MICFLHCLTVWAATDVEEQVLILFGRTLSGRIPGTWERVRFWSMDLCSFQADPSTLPTSSSVALFLGLRFCRCWVALNQTLPPHMPSWLWGLFRSSCPCCIGLKPRQSCLRPSYTWVFYLLNTGCVLCKPVSACPNQVAQAQDVIILFCLLNLNIPISPKHFYNLISFVSGYFLCYSQEILS